MISSEVKVGERLLCTLWGGLTANKVTASPAAVATMLIADNERGKASTFANK